MRWEKKKKTHTQTDLCTEGEGLASLAFFSFGRQQQAFFLAFFWQAGGRRKEGAEHGLLGRPGTALGRHFSCILAHILQLCPLLVFI